MVQVLKRFGVPLGVICLVGFAWWCRHNSGVKSFISDFFAPLLGKREDVKSHVEGDSLIWLSKPELVSRIHGLEEQLQQREFNAAQFRGLEGENKELRALSKLPAHYGYHYVHAQIVSRDVVSGMRRLRINRGSGQQLASGQVVLPHGQLLGRILEVSRTTALVLTVDDENCRVSVRIVASSCHGILTGIPGSAALTKRMCVVDFLPRDREYASGLVFETSGYDRVVPSGIPVGVLAEEGQVKTVNNLYKQAVIAPYVFDREFAFVTVIVPD